ncbi:phage holin family protein [Brachybacterium huguangmaarense]|uniref:Phage holin family protein n=1 Tax=Brachybacterium huguangmaarense TaxID=1652028 RepID=A0ABY6FY01_9MICO|nr:phage holin family protein [Brachybacterium huguangmaarense]UYG15737.1 phage holin family protein [Brachybacterium huguangmaarense]
MSTEYTPPATEAERRAQDESLGTLLSQVSTDLSTLIRQETALAKAELRESAKKAGRGAGLLGGAGVAGHFVLLFLSIALWAAIGGTAVGYAWSAVIVAVLWGIVAAVLAITGKKSLDQIEGVPQTTDSLKKIPEAVTPSKEAR